MNASAAKSVPCDVAQPSKRDAIIEGATEVFLANGYGAASMAQIASAAGVSKQTVYAHFGGKDALFEAIIERKCAAFMRPMTAQSLAGEPVVIVLRRTAESFIDTIFSVESMTLYRIIVAECARFPELAAAFYRSGPRVAADTLAAYLSEFDKRGELRVANPKSSAELFFAMLRGDLYLRRLLEVTPDPTSEETVEALTRVVEVFLAVHAPGEA